VKKKSILITGQGSYIGLSFIKWLENWEDKFEVQELSVRGDKWKQVNFSKYDVVLHVAGIAHVSADPGLEQQYYKINRDLAIEVAKKAKAELVKKFIFMSSMIIYGDDSKVGENKIITQETIPNPIDFYGRSKLEADIAIQKLASEEFKTIIVRTPMVYGPNCKGNFPRLKKIAEKSPIFPNIDNERSMIYIDNLCEFLRLAIDDDQSGVFFPQNNEYMSTKNIINIMADTLGKKVYYIKLFNPVIQLMSKKINIVNKVLGNKVYDKQLSNNSYNYCVVNCEESIRRSIIDSE
jgi:nucleoside-diphosphate-sugar epimerase